MRFQQHVAPTTDDCRRESAVHALVAELGVDPGALHAATLTNTSAHAPYHGAQHLFTVAINADAGAKAYGLGREDRAALLIAALFHDVDHLMGHAVSDRQNIDRAVAAFTVYARSSNAGLSSAAELIIRDLVRATEFPHAHPPTIAGQILQDADMMQELEPDGPRFLAGLSIEAGHLIDDAYSRRFLESLTLNTEWARGRLAAHLRRRA